MGSFRACELLVTACGIWFPDQGANPGPLHWELRVLATGPLEKPLQLNVCALAVMSLSFQKHCDWRAVKGWSDRGLRSSHSDAGKMTLRRLQKVCLCVCVCVCDAGVHLENIKESCWTFSSLETYRVGRGMKNDTGEMRWFVISSKLLDFILCDSVSEREWINIVLLLLFWEVFY